MAIEKDFLSTVNLASLPSVSQEQIMQAINHIAPLSNKGLIIVQPGNSAGGTGHPDVANNPRYVDYAWIDTENALAPTVKVNKYAGYTTPPSSLHADWIEAIPQDASITNEMLAADAITLNKFDISEFVGNPLYVLRTNSAADGVEYASVTTLFGANQLALNAIDDSAAANNSLIIKDSSGSLIFQAINTFATSIQAAIASLELGQLSVSGAADGYGIFISGGVWTPMDMVLGRLKQSGAADGQVPAWSGAAWTPTTLGVGAKFEYPSPNSFATDDATGFVNAEHGLAAIPTTIRAVLRCITADAGYVADDEVDINSICSIALDGANANRLLGATWHGLWCNATHIGISFLCIGASADTATATAYNIRDKNVNNTISTLTTANWRLVLRAWK